MNEVTSEDLALDLQASRLRVCDLGKTICEADLRVIAARALRRAMRAEAIINAPVVALFADGRDPTANERHLLNLLSWREREAAEAKEEVKRLQGIVASLSDRVAAQSELLSRRAEKE